MSLQFYFGPSGSGKSRKLYTEILKSAEANPNRNYLIIVPDQFTMQTQKDFVTLSSRGGIMNIDVLSFGRLSHRILEEVGWEDVPVLDDTGKCLVLQKVACGLQKELPVLGSLLKRQGYIHEVKSAVSEFMQYGIGTEDVSKLVQLAEGHGALQLKLKDLEVIYQAFADYIRSRFITTEEKLQVVARALSKSKLIPGSVVVFDGFTGFTPIQNEVLKELMRLCDEVVMSFTLGAGENPHVIRGEQELFYLTKKTVADMERMAEREAVARKDDVFISDGGQHRFWRAPQLAHLERELFRFPHKVYDPKGAGSGDRHSIRLFEAVNPKEEVQQTAMEIRRLIREEGFLYRDIAIVVGNLEEYASYVENEFLKFEIPVFMDRTREITLNPVIEFIGSALELYEDNFSYKSVFRFLRSGLSCLSKEETDLLENYCIRTGIRGEKKWSALFTRKTEEMGQDEEKLARINALRARFYEQVKGLKIKGKAPASEYVEKLYDFLENAQVQEQLADYAKRFAERNDLSRAKEYEQIYNLVALLLEQIHGLLGEEEITISEFREILEAGFGEIEVGTIPQNVDRVTVGDMERSRLKQIKALFFMGVNDGNIPRNSAKGGLISDMDREFLRSGMGELRLELAPSPRQQIFIQRFYLYLNLTKPSDRLYISYAKMDNNGKSLRPAYLIETVRELFPEIRTETPGNRDAILQIETTAQGADFLARGLREYAEGRESQGFEAVYRIYGDVDGGILREKLERAAFMRYKGEALSKAVTGLLYGSRLHLSVSRLETFAACAYRYFLQYGLSLNERKEFQFERADLGTIYHGVLEKFGRGLEADGQNWFGFTREYAEENVHKILHEITDSYGAEVLYGSERNRYAITRMERILTRTVLTMQEQLQKGCFEPKGYELSLQFADDPESIHVDLSEQEKLVLRGTIDRLDLAEDEDHVYVKIVDYKSGKKEFDLVMLYYGLQLQLVVYMNAAVEQEKKRNPGKKTVPAAMLYYHIDDPVVEEGENTFTDEELRDAIRKALRPNGVVNSDTNVIFKLDADIGASSDAIPAGVKKNGELSSASRVLSDEQFDLISRYANHKITQFGKQITEGFIDIDPYEYKGQDSCTYCDYKKVCGFDPAIPGFKKRKLQSPGALPEEFEKELEKE